MTKDKFFFIIVHIKLENNTYNACFKFWLYIYTETCIKIRFSIEQNINYGHLNGRNSIMLPVQDI